MFDEEIVKKYPISQEEITALSKQVIDITTHGKEPVQNPTCVLVMGQSGAGKSGLIAHSKKMFPDGNVVVLEDDDLRKFFPGEKEIAQEHPNEYIPITNQLSRPLTQQMFAHLMEQGYNMIFHQTGGSLTIADDGIVKLMNNGYSIQINCLGVSGEKSLCSMISRGLAEIEYCGCYRPVTVSDHDRTYNGMPKTLKYIEETGRYDAIQVFSRGPKPDQPIQIYSKVNTERPTHVQNILSHPNVNFEEPTGEFDSAHDALIAIREDDREDFIANYPEVRESILSNPYITSELAEQISILDQRVGLTQEQPQEQIIENASTQTAESSPIITTSNTSQN